AGLADTHQHPRSDELRITDGQPATGGGGAPDRAGYRQHVDSVGPVGEPADGNGNEAVKEGEIESADEAELPVRDVQSVLDGLGQDGEQGAIEKIEDVDAAQHGQSDPGA